MQTPPSKRRTQSKRTVNSETPKTPKTPKEAPQPEIDPSLVSPTGDLVLVVKRHDDSVHGLSKGTDQPQEAEESFSYRVESKRLQETSPYFARLLDPQKFGEGATIAKHHADLKAKHATFDTVPMSDLPHVQIADVGRISPAVKSIQNLMSDFLRALHDLDLTVRLPPLANIANLAVVADRFDALAAMRQYFKSKKLMAALDAKSGVTAKGADKTLKSWPEERVRQKLLVGLLLDNPAWVWHSSLRLIHRGWVGRETDDASSALWWDLPLGVEEELLFRRDCILETVQSLQSHFLNLYSSKDRQCKLGYDSSAECDLFQLGQMIKFFKRINTLSLDGSIITTTDPPDPYEGDVFELLDAFRQTPEYQIDKNHHHCGLRTRIMPLLDLITFSLTQEIGLCLHCWQEARYDYAWSKAKRPLVWNHGSAGAAMIQAYKAKQAQNHLFKHLDSRHLFMANERHWTD